MWLAITYHMLHTLFHLNWRLANTLRLTCMHIYAWMCAQWSIWSLFHNNYNAHHIISILLCPTFHFVLTFYVCITPMFSLSGKFVIFLLNLVSSLYIYKRVCVSPRFYEIIAIGPTLFVHTTKHKRGTNTRRERTWRGTTHRCTYTHINT